MVEQTLVVGLIKLQELDKAQEDQGMEQDQVKVLDKV